MQGFKRFIFDVVNFGGEKSVGEFLAVGTDVLDWSSAGGAGDFAQGFDAGEATLGRIGYDGVPVGTTEGRHPLSWDDVPNTSHGIADDDAMEAVVTRDGVGAATKDVKWEVFFGNKIKSRCDIV